MKKALSVILLSALMVGLTPNPASAAFSGNPVGRIQFYAMAGESTWKRSLIVRINDRWYKASPFLKMNCSPREMHPRCVPWFVSNLDPYNGSFAMFEVTYN